MSLQDHPRVADWVTVKDGRLQVHTGKVDIGQRISTALLQIAHEELTIAPNQIDIARVRTGYAPDEGMTSGSNSIEQSGHALRCATATLRAHLVEYVAAQHGGTAADWQLEDGDLYLPGSNLRFHLIDLIAEIPDDIPIDPNAELRDLIDAKMPKPAMLGLADIVSGRYEFVQDLDLPGMHHARVVRPPHAKARLKNLPQKAIDDLDAKGLTLTHDGSFLAISGPQEWPVIQAAEKLAAACLWDQNGGVPEMDIFAELTPENAQSFPVINGTPNEAPLPADLKKPDISARYERPYQMHAPLAPSAAMALWSDTVLHIHSQSQGIYPLRDSIADSLGLHALQVEITHVPGSGCYGHTGADDAAFEAALVALARPDVPILLKWTRADEHGWEPYASAMAVDLAATVDDGQITAYSAKAFSDTHRGRPRAGPNRAGPAKLLANHFRATPIGPIEAEPNMGNHAGMHRNLDPVYDFSDTRLTKNLVRSLPHRTSAMRCLGGAANLFALESFMDEMARQEDADPFAFRRAHLNDARGLDVLRELESRVAKTPKTGGRGIAYGQYKNKMTRVAICVDIDVSDKAEVQLRRATIVADAGRVIDADGLVAQMEGGFIQAASWALYEQVQWDREGITSRDWDSYPVIRFDNIPDIHVTLLDQPNQKSVGAGEASSGPALAAIANAIFDATGLRMRRMPFTPSALRTLAYEA